MVYTTKDIVKQIANHIKKTNNSLLQYNSFDEWIEKFRKKEEEYKNIFPIEVHKNFPLHDDVIKLIVKELFSIMPFSKPYILQNYERHLDGIDYLLYPSSNPHRLIILFSGLSGHKTYNRYSWYWDETEKWESNTVYLFLNDLSEQWYVGNDENPMGEKYIKIIQSVLNEYNISRSKTFTVGGSMGGYGAIFYAINMGLKGAIAIHPQITYKATRKHRADDWGKKIRACGSQFYDLTDYLFKRNIIPFLYLEYGLYEADREGAEELISTFQKRQALVIIRKTANPDHVTNNPSKQTIESIITFFENTGFDDKYIK